MKVIENGWTYTRVDAPLTAVEDEDEDAHAHAGRTRGTRRALLAGRLKKSLSQSQDG